MEVKSPMLFLSVIIFSLTNLLTPYRLGIKKAEIKASANLKISFFPLRKNHE